MVLSTLLMATTSSELGGLFARHHGHKLAQGYGMFFWAGVVLFIATAWQVECGTGVVAEPGKAQAIAPDFARHGSLGPTPFRPPPERHERRLILGVRPTRTSPRKG